MQVGKVRVVEYNDGTSYVYPYTEDEVTSHSDVLKTMIKRIMKHRGIDDVYNTYVDNTLQMRSSIVYTNVLFSDVPSGIKRCGSIDGIGRNCSNCSKCILFSRVN